MYKPFFPLIATASVLALSAAAYAASEGHDHVGDEVVTKQRHMLAKTTDGAGFGPQSPRDIDTVVGNNQRAFEVVPAHTERNLCNRHCH